jgi:S-adenosylmethionine-dependent methyltransferase
VVLTNIICANALDIRSVPAVFRENHYDIVLCQGPLYHLLSLDERLHVLRSCMSATKRAGFVIAAFVTKYAHLRDLAQREPLRLGREAGYYARYLETGEYTRNPRNVGHHTYREEVRALFGMCGGREGEVGVGLEVERMVACESFLGGGLAAGVYGLDEEAFGAWLEVALGAAEDLDVGTGDHLLVVARKVVSEKV